MRASDHPYFDAPPLALAHRGGTAYGPNDGIENSLLAFQHAVDLGYRYLETDVHTTSDGVVLAAHDEHLDRVTDATGAIAELPYAAVREARIGGREVIPTLSEVLDAFPTTRINIDLKSPGAVEPTIEVLARHHAWDRVCVGSFGRDRLTRYRQLATQVADRPIATAAGQWGTAALRFLPAMLSRWLHSPAQALQVPEYHRIQGRWVRVVTPGLLRTAHRLGKQVHVWFYQPEDAATVHRLLDLGVDGIVSDRIEVTKAVFLDRGLPW